MAGTIIRGVRHFGRRIVRDTAPATEIPDSEVVAELPMDAQHDYHTEISDGTFRVVRRRRKPSALDSTGRNPTIVAANARRREFWQNRRRP